MQYEKLTLRIVRLWHLLAFGVLLCGGRRYVKACYFRTLVPRVHLLEVGCWSVVALTHLVGVRTAFHPDELL